VTVAVLTGAGGSLGRAIARRLAADGHLAAVTGAGGPGLGELAAVVSFLAGPDASHASGQTIEVNGEWVMS
jgi:NAD(P)-dependent dehydrogenase (short-subunit alcohol dehydrogenase family)